MTFASISILLPTTASALALIMALLTGLDVRELLLCRSIVFSRLIAEEVRLDHDALVDRGARGGHTQRRAVQLCKVCSRLP